VFEQPVKAVYNTDNRLVNLVFDKGNADYFVRGGLTWPTMTEAGVVVVGMQSVFTRHIIINEQIEFTNIDFYIADGAFKNGAVQIFNDLWDRYKCTMFFVCGDNDLHKSFAVQIYRNFQTKKKPLFYYIEKAAVTDYSDSLIMQYSREGRLSVERGSLLERQLSNPAGSQSAVSAFRNLICGYELAPWKEPL
jgi:hypothetical protein